MALIPDRSTFSPNDAVTGSSGTSGELVALHLGRVVAQATVTADGRWDLGALSQGGYSLRLESVGRPDEHGALEVLADPVMRIRYGFVADFAEGVDVGARVAWAQLLHLNAVQFYDWAYRHAQLVSPTPSYNDPLGRPVSLEVVRALIEGFSTIAAQSIAYAAVYAFGREDMDRWSGHRLYRSDGRPWQLGDDFLWIADVSDQTWQAHLVKQLQQALSLGFDGFHLDQYGWPKRAMRLDGTPVHIASAFVELITRIRAALPSSTLIFNNVNDFPTALTALAPQDVTYIEVWAPHTDLRHLSEIVANARRLAPTRPVVLSAYLRVFADIGGPSNETTADIEAAIACLELTMAAIVSGGASHLLSGEDGCVLTDPYYPHNHHAGECARRALVRLYDFQVALGDLLFTPDAVDISRTWFGGVNTELVIEGPPNFRVDPTPGAIWVRAFEVTGGVVLHLINLLAQSETKWDAPKAPHITVERCTVSIERHDRRPSSAWVASTETGPTLRPLPIDSIDDREYVEVRLQGAWTVVYFERATS